MIHPRPAGVYVVWKSIVLVVDLSQEFLDDVLQGYHADHRAAGLADEDHVSMPLNEPLKGGGRRRGLW